VSALRVLIFIFVIGVFHWNKPSLVNGDSLHVLLAESHPALAQITVRKENGPHDVEMPRRSRLVVSKWVNAFYRTKAGFMPAHGVWKNERKEFFNVTWLEWWNHGQTAWAPKKAVLGPRQPLALRAVPITAGIIGDADLPARARGFRPPNDICATWTREGFQIHPEWRTDPKYRWVPHGNVLLKSLRQLQGELDETYAGRHS
jgi:hypothetical protein